MEETCANERRFEPRRTAAKTRRSLLNARSDSLQPGQAALHERCRLFVSPVPKIIEQRPH